MRHAHKKDYRQHLNASKGLKLSEKSRLNREKLEKEEAIHSTAVGQETDRAWLRLNKEQAEAEVTQIHAHVLFFLPPSTTLVEKSENSLF